MKYISFLLLTILLLSCHNKTADQSSTLLPDMTTLRNGDLIFRKGRSNLSRIIMTIYPGEFSHTGILLKKDDGWYVIHASENDDDGKREEVIEVPVSQFIKGAKGYGIARVKCTPRQVEIATRVAIKMARAKIPFDTDYNLKDASKVYCTELVYVAYKAAGIDLLRTIPPHRATVFTNYLFPEDLWKNTSVSPLSIKRLEK